MSIRRKTSAFDIINTVMMAAFIIITLYPFWYAIIGSFNEGVDFSLGGVWLLPRKFTFVNYMAVVGDSLFWSSAVTTVLRTVIGTVSGLLFTSFVAYSMSRPALKGKKVFRGLSLFTMFFSGGLVPYYIVILITGLYDTFWVYIIPSLYSVYNMIICSSFFSGLPVGLSESAKLDGASEWKIWWSIYMPLSKSVLATIGLWLAVGHWNSYFQTMLYTTDPRLTTLQYYLVMQIKQSHNISGEIGENFETVTSQSMTFASIVVATLPILCVYPFLQRFFTKGLMLGSLKG